MTTEEARRLAVAKYLHSFVAMFGGNSVEWESLWSGGQNVYLAAADSVMALVEPAYHPPAITAARGESDPPPMDIQDPRQVVRQLKAYMKNQSISYGELSRGLGHDDSSQVSRWMNLRVEPRISTLKEIQRVLTNIERERKGKRG